MGRVAMEMPGQSWCSGGGFLEGGPEGKLSYSLFKETLSNYPTWFCAVAALIDPLTNYPPAAIQGDVSLEII